MNHILHLVRTVIFTGFFALMIGIENIEKSALLWTFLVTIFLTRLTEAFTPAAEALRSYHKEEDESRLTTWLMGTTFLTNVVAPMLEYRYKDWPEVPATEWWNWMGLLILIGGSALRLWAIHETGASFVPHVKVDAKLKLVTGGPYAYVRHPSYLGNILAYLGIAIIFSSLIAAIALVVLVLPTLVLRIIKEEKLLAARLSDPWRKYQSKTPWRLIPGLW